MANETEKARHIAPVKLELLITVVPRDKAAFYLDLLQAFEVNAQFALPARGTADQEILRYLGLSDVEKTVILSVAREDRLDTLLETLSQKFRTIKNGAGVAAAIPFSSMIGTLLYGFLSNDSRTVKGGTEA